MLPFAILGGCLGVGVLPAFAANQSVGIVDYAFEPSSVAVKPGESVTWQAEGSFPHSVHFEGEASLGTPDPDFSATKAFPAAGVYRYFCDQHAFMRGTVYVNDAGTVPTPSPTATSSPTASPTASPTSSPGSGGSGGTPGGGGPTSGPSPAGSTAVTSFRLRATVRKRKVTLVVTVGAREAVRVRGTLRRGGKRVRRVSLLAQPGRHRVRLRGKALRPGRYTLTLRAGDLRRTVRFKVRR